MSIFNRIVRIKNSNIHIDRLVLIDNIYIDDNTDPEDYDLVDLEVNTIGHLVIYNTPKYETNVYYNLIDKVIDRGVIELNDIVLNELEYKRFSKVKLFNCIISDEKYHENVIIQ